MERKPFCVVKTFSLHGEDLLCGAPPPGAHFSTFEMAPEAKWPTFSRLSFFHPASYFLHSNTLFTFFAKVSFLRRKTNITQAPGQDTPRCVTLGGLYTAAERIQPAEQEQRPGEGGGVRCGVLARGEGGAGVLPQKRCDWTGRRQNWPTVAGPMPRAVRLC